MVVLLAPRRPKMAVLWPPSHQQVMASLLVPGRRSADHKAFFATDHIVLDAKGKEVEVSNIVGAANANGLPWMLLDTSRAIKPFIRQTAQEARVRRQDEPRPRTRRSTPRSSSTVLMAARTSASASGAPRSARRQR